MEDDTSAYRSRCCCGQRYSPDIASCGATDKCYSFHRLGWVKKESIAILRLAWPMALSYVLKQVVFFVSLIFSGHIDENSSVPLDAAGIALSLINITGFSVAMGLGAAMDTLASQAWGAKSYLKVGIYLQRGILVFALAMLPVYALWVNIESVLNLLQQPPCVVEQAKDYIHVFSSCLPALFLNILLERYLQVQNIVYPLIITGVIANVVNVVAHCLFVLVAKWGIRGAGASTALSMYALTISLLVIIFVRKLHKKTWGGWSREALKDWGQFARYGIPGFVMLCVEWWSFEMGYIVAGSLPDGVIQQGIHAITINYGTVIFMIPYSLSLAASVRVGNELGAGRPSAAKRSFVLSLVFLCMWLFFIEVFTFSLKREIVKIFTSDPCLMNEICIPLFLFLINVAGDHSQGFLSGVVRGCGRQLLGAVTNFFSYAIGVTVGCVLVFVAKLGVMGYWLGMSLSVGIQTIVYLVILLSMSWQKQSIKAQKNARLVLGDNLNSGDEKSRTNESQQQSSFEMIPLEEPSDESLSTKISTDVRLDYDQNGGIEMEQESVKLLAVTSFKGSFDDLSSVRGEGGNELESNNIHLSASDSYHGGTGGGKNERANCIEPNLKVLEESRADFEIKEPKIGDFESERSALALDDDQNIPLISDIEDDSEKERVNVNTQHIVSPWWGCLPFRTIMYRLVLLLTLVGMFVLSLIVSQLYVYSPLPCSVNTTVSGNESNISCVVFEDFFCKI